MNGGILDFHGPIADGYKGIRSGRVHHDQANFRCSASRHRPYGNLKILVGEETTKASLELGGYEHLNMLSKAGKSTALGRNVYYNRSVAGVGITISCCAGFRSGSATVCKSSGGGIVQHGV